MSQDLVLVDTGLPSEQDRKRALTELAIAAEQASTPHEAREIMVKAKAVGALLKDFQAPYEESWLAGKASLVACKRLAKMVSELSSRPQLIPAGNGHAALGSTKSERTKVLDSLGIKKNLAFNLMRLSRVDEASFQCYIQDKSAIPSVYGALRQCAPAFKYPKSARVKRNQRVGVKYPANPSVDEAYSLIVKALGHLSGSADFKGNLKGQGKPKRDLSLAIDYLYEAEDLIKPYRGGYVK